MGLLAKLLTLPVLGPIEGVRWIAQTVAEQAERELYDEDAVRGRLQELELRYQLGEIDERAYLTAEEELLAKLKTIRAWRAESDEDGYQG
jgi:hypothetical protein